MTVLEQANVADNLPTRVDLPEIPEGRGRDAWDFLQSAITTLYDLVRANPDDTEGLARAQVLAGRMKKEIDLLTDEITPILWDSMGEAKELTIEGFGHVQKRYGSSNTAWQHDEIWRRVKSTLCADITTDDGEITATPYQAIDRAIDLAAETVAKGSYRKGTLKERLGLEPDEVSEVSWGKRSIQITGGSPNERH